MPWHVARSAKCPDARPWAVVKETDGSVEGCHASKEAAEHQMAALYASEKDSAVKLKYIGGDVRAADAGGFEAVISTPRMDADMESVLPRGLVNRDEYMANPLVYWAHEWAFNPAAEPIGKATRLDIFDDRIESAAVYAPTLKAQNVRALVAGGFVRKTSVGFDSYELKEIAGVPTHVRWALREYSVVPLPANTDATITGVKSALSWLAEQMPTDELPDYQSVNLTLAVDAEKLLNALDVAGWTLDSTHAGVIVVDHKKIIAHIARRRMVRALRA